VTETRTYDACGNMLTSDVGVGRTKHEYDAGNQYMAPSLIELTGSGPGFYPNLTVTSTRYAPNGQPLWQYDNEDRRTDFEYDPAGRPTLLTAASGATVTFAYDDADMTQTLTVMDGEKPPSLAAYEVRAFDGKGNLSRVSRATADGWDIEEYRYDRRGRLNASTAPYREGTAPSWSTVDYDSLSRPVRLTDPDGGLTEWRYDELAHPQNASPATVPGSCMRVTDPRGRERWQRSGPLGSVEEVVEPAPDGSGAVFPAGGSLTTYSYDPNGNISTIELSVHGSATQQRRFRHDSLGRLVRAFLPEAGDGIVEDHAGRTKRWSRSWEYDQRSNVTEIIDSRGVEVVPSSVELRWRPP
jgi:YD repeat-containing protein